MKTNTEGHSHTDDEPSRDAAETAIDHSKDENLTWDGARHSHAFRRWAHRERNEKSGRG